MKIKFKYYISEFIKSNDLDFNVTGSGLNLNCVALAGFALFLASELGIGDAEVAYDFTIESIEIDSEIKMSSDFIDEFSRVFEYAKNNHYHLWWKNKYNRESYNLDFFTELKDK